MVEYEETATPEPGSRSQPIVIIGGELRLKVAAGSRKAGEQGNQTFRAKVGSR